MHTIVLPTPADPKSLELKPTTIEDNLKDFLIKVERVEQTSQADLVELPGFLQNKFLQTLHYAYGNHVGFVLTPQAVWALIQNGLMMHVNLNSKELRTKFVDFEGKETVEILTPGISGGAEDWESCLIDFKEGVEKKIGKTNTRLMLPSFSGTTSTESAVFNVLLLGTTKDYMNYSRLTCCGIPSIHITGSLEDWCKIKGRVELFEIWDSDKVKLDWWTKPLMKALDKIINSLGGDTDLTFFDEFYKNSGMSGGPYVTGWVNVLFPYLIEGRKNYFVDYFARDKLDNRFGALANHFPSCFSEVPFVWRILGGDIHNMSWAAGFVGATIDPGLNALKPVLGWAVLHDEGRKQQAKKQKII